MAKVDRSHSRPSVYNFDSLIEIVPVQRILLGIHFSTNLGVWGKVAIVYGVWGKVAIVYGVWGKVAIVYGVFKKGYT